MSQKNTNIFFMFVLSAIYMFSIPVLLNAQEDWDSLFSVVKSKHFIIRYRCDKSIADKVRKYAEQYYESIEKDFDLTRYSNFWTWEHRCEIVLFASQEEYRIATRQPSWSGGHVDYKNRIIYSYPWAKGFVDSLLPHELAHIMFREYVKDNSNIPLWLDEGIAQYVEKAPYTDQDEILLDAVRNGTYIPFDRLQKVRGLAHTTKISNVHLFYAQSQSIVDFMIRTYGKARFSYFLSQLRAGKTVSQALRFSYPKAIDSMAKMQSKWLEMMRGLS